ncbi:MAG: phosphodiester glycosidase family protein [Muribaculaceae bacterium]|nr:phosphodiester glycosidase family protein [Muribaculaceae bacterium]
MKKRFLTLLLIVSSIFVVNAESFTNGNETYNYTITETSTPSTGVKHTRMRFTAPSACNVSIAEVDLTNKDVRVEAFIGQDKLQNLEKPTTFSARKTSAGRNPIVVQNGHFWSMSSQTATSAGVHATNTCLGGCMVNGSIITETNYTNDQWNGGPTRHGVLGFTSDGKAHIGNYQTLIKAMCPAKWGTDEATNSLLITEVNKYCIASDFMALFTPEYPSEQAFKVINTSAGQPGTEVTGSATEVYLTLDAGQTMKHNGWITATVGKILTNTSRGTRGNYDLVLVAAPGVSQSVLSSVAVGDQMKFKYYWHPANNTNSIPDFENVIAGNAIIMQNGAITTRATDESYNTTSYARSLYGINADGTKLYMCVVDKGQNAEEGVSYGATCTRIGYIMKHFGAQTVLQVDGGGSAQMAINGSLATKPADGSERSVASGIVVYSNGSATDTPDEPEQPSTEVGYSLSQDWVHTSGHIAAAASGRCWSTGFDGKIYFNDYAGSKLYYWTKNGLTDAGTSAAGSAITSDDAGNIILSTTVWSAAATSFKVLPSGSSSYQDLTITLPNGMASASMKYIGKAIGNIMSAEGGAVYIIPSGATSVAKIIIKNGVQLSATAIDVSSVTTADAETFAIPLTTDINSDEIAVRDRRKKHFYHNSNGTFEAYPDNGITTTQGGTLFTLNDTQFAVEPIGTSYCDGFQIINVEKNEIIATHTEQYSTAAISSNPNSFTAEIISNYEAKLYQYVPGQLAAQYTFKVDETVGVEVVEEENIKVFVEKGNICILGNADTIEVYSISGILISKNSREIECQPGIYIVKVDDGVTKVIVR